MECLSAAASTSLKNGQTPNPRHSQLQYVLCMHDKKKEYQIPHITASFFTIIKAGSNVWNQHFSIVLGLQYLSPSLLIVMVCNAAAMEYGLAAVLACAVQVHPEQWNNAIVGRVLPRVVDKGFSGRPGAVNLAEEIVLEFVHLCSAEDTIAVLLEGSRNKRPKVLPLCVSSILACFKAFGPRTVPVAAVKKEFEALCESTVNNVCPNAVKLMGERYRWTCPTLVEDIMANPTNQWLLEDRYCPRPAKEAQEGVRPGEFADTINLLDCLPKTEFKAKMALSKWSEKVDALKIILDIVGSVPKLETDDYNDLVQTLKT
ncbi:hypothetical protein B5M09_001058 [Aphanomyces astaci]|uniref:XMAP215/Dis1/CLASP TOG domain-containing protein n=1 Tax=Aphanomyces astaci TaxID=112090 RepID=A0A3R7WJ46_APHAT|nr:hypothetical protein B5M09_001058 [Aphanomyces astaci]